MREKKSAQTTIFVIIAIVIVSGLLFYFIFYSPSDLFPGSMKNPQSNIETCIGGSLDEGYQNIIDNSGFAEIPEPSLNYQGKKIPFLCYVEGQKELCLNIHPILSEEIKTGIELELREKIVDCFDSLKQHYSEENYEEGELNMSLEILPEQIKLNVKKRITITVNGEKHDYELFNIVKRSPLFDFLKISNEILNQEVECNCLVDACYPDIIQINKDHTDFDTDIYVNTRNEKVYTIQEIKTGDKFMFAVRNCIL